MATDEFNKSLLILKRIEDKYGSITCVPEDDPDYIKLREIYPENDHPSRKIRSDSEYKINVLLNKGYSNNEIAAKLYVNESLVSNYVHRNHLHYKRKFRYRIIDSTGTVYYTSNLQAFIKVKWGKFLAHNTKKFIKLHYCKLRTVNAHRFSIPIGSYYYLPYLDKPVMKTSDDSYIFATTITNG